MSLTESKTKMSDFYKQLEAERNHKIKADQIKNSRSAKLNKIHQEMECAKEECTKDLLAKIYRDALPMDDQFKASCAPELDNGVISFIQKRSPNGSCFHYVVECKNRGSIPAKNMIKAVTEAVTNEFKKFYEELEETDADDIKLSDSSRNDITDAISIKMDYPEISKIIETNVQNTVQDEMTKSKTESDKLQQIQDSLTTDDSVVTEEAIDKVLHRKGLDNKPFKPSLFTGIMINKVDAFTESANDTLTDEDIEKKAFFESVKEFAKWSMLSVLDFEKIDDRKNKSLGMKYARGTI